MIHYYDIQQGSEDWLKLRKGKLTGSNATAIGANGKGLQTYCKEIAMELIDIENDFYINSDMQRGNELEPIAAMAYELQFDVKINEVGFIVNEKYKNVGVSPDRLISDDGGIEIKARNNKKHFDLILGDEKEIPYNQIQMCLLITEREYWDFVSYNPNFAKPLFVKRIFQDEYYFEKLKAGFEYGDKLINEYLEIYKSYNLSINNI